MSSFLFCKVFQAFYNWDQFESGHIFFSIDNKKSIQGLILHKIGMIAVNMRYITAIDPLDIYKFITSDKKKE